MMLEKMLLIVIQFTSIIDGLSKVTDIPIVHCFKSPESLGFPQKESCEQEEETQVFERKVD